jgi:Zn-dependent peptidase ImmA (M78 family)/DNA-binding XRE family transcriptional regulator
MTRGDKIRQAREIRGMTQEKLGSEIGRSKALIAQVERGFKEASSDLMEAIAFATKFPLTFFDVPPHIEFPISEVIFRAKADISRKDILAAVRYTEHVFGIALSLSRRLKSIPVGIKSLSSNPITAARETRQLMKIDPHEPIVNMIRTLERVGVWCFAMPVLEDGDAFCLWMEIEQRSIPIIAVSAKAPVDRLRLSVAHELGHLVLHRDSILRSRKDVEEEAFSFAAEFCMPAQAMEREMTGPITLSTLARLKLRWGISIAALVRRAHELKLITTRQYHYLFQQLSARGWRTEEPPQLNIAVDRPRLVRNMAELIYGFPINYHKFAGDTRLSEQELRSIMALYADRKELEKEDAPPKARVFAFPKGVLEGV